MTKTEALNKAAQEAGWKDFDDVKENYTWEEILMVEFDAIIHRAMDIFAGENETIEMLRRSLADMTAKCILCIFEKEAGGWISVEERLPDAEGYYLVVVDEKVASSRRGVVEISDCYKTVHTGEVKLSFQPYVTHWKPLPTAP